MDNMIGANQLWDLADSLGFTLEGHEDGSVTGSSKARALRFSDVTVPVRLAVCGSCSDGAGKVALLCCGPGNLLLLLVTKVMRGTRLSLYVLDRAKVSGKAEDLMLNTVHDVAETVGWFRSAIVRVFHKQMDDTWEEAPRRAINA